MYLFAYKSMTTALASNGGHRIEIYKPCALGALATRLSFLASSSLVAVVARSAAPSGPLTLTSGVSGGLGGTEPAVW